MSTKTLSHEDIPATYAALVSLWMPRPLHDDLELSKAHIRTLAEHFALDPAALLA